MTIIDSLAIAILGGIGAVAGDHDDAGDSGLAQGAEIGFAIDDHTELIGAGGPPAIPPGFKLHLLPVPCDRPL